MVFVRAGCYFFWARRVGRRAPQNYWRQPIQTRYVFSFWWRENTTCFGDSDLVSLQSQCMSASTFGRDVPTYSERLLGLLLTEARSIQGECLLKYSENIMARHGIVTVSVLC
jgi:hypothetical protein